MRPPYKITSSILQLVAAIAEKLGEVNSSHLYKPPASLRRLNRIKTIQSSLEIEGNTMSIDQVTALLNKKRVLASKKDIIEVKNAIKVYGEMADYNIYEATSLLDAHKILMNGLIDKPGKFRTSNVGIIKGSKLTHVAPPGNMVHGLMQDLLNYLAEDDDLLLIKSCVFHYELEFIHPFTDGNGRMGRLWQTLILRAYSPVFEFLPIEALIKERQQEYYEALNKADSQGESTPFIEFMLEVILVAIESILQTQNISLTSTDRIILYKDIVGNNFFTRQDYLRNYKNISSATASRDLKEAVVKKILKKIGDKRTTKYRYL